MKKRIAVSIFLILLIAFVIVIPTLADKITSIIFSFIM